MDEKHVPFVVVTDAVGDPDTYSKVGLRCDLGVCRRLIRGNAVMVILEGRASFYHDDCAPQPLPKSEK
jgi:hypothetical protein